MAKYSSRRSSVTFYIVVVVLVNIAAAADAVSFACYTAIVK
jgi:hypothetical protein